MKQCKNFWLRGSAYLKKNNLTQQIDIISSDRGIREKNASKKTSYFWICKITNFAIITRARRGETTA